MTNKRFIHEFIDHSADGSLSFIVEALPPARIKLDVDDEGGGFWFSANREGWLHFAKIAAELGVGNYENGYHFHVNENFKWSENPPDFTFEVNNELT